MDSIGFKLFADPTELERGVVRAKKSVENLDKEAKLVTKTFGAIGKAMSVVPVLQGFSAVINKAQELRNESLKNGKAIDANTAALARYGDTLDKIKSTAAEMAVKVVGSLTNAGERTGSLVSMVGKIGKGIIQGRGLKGSVDNAANEMADNARSEKGAEFATASEQVTRDLQKKRNDAIISQLETEEKIAYIKKQVALDEQKLAMLPAEDLRRVPIMRELGDKKIDLDTAETQLQKELVDSIQKQIEKEREILKKKEEKAKAEAERIKTLKEEQKHAQESVEKRKDNLKDSIEDRSKMSLQELANLNPLSVGVGVDIGNKSKSAREALDLEQKAKESRLSGDIQGAMENQSKADELRAGLGDVLKSGESDPFKAQKEALKESEEQLKAINEKLAGKFVNE